MVTTLSTFPKKTFGIIRSYDEKGVVPTKIIEMGLLPDTEFQILYQAPFGGPLYIEFGTEKNRVALRTEEAAFILVEKVEHH